MRSRNTVRPSISISEQALKLATVLLCLGIALLAQSSPSTRPQKFRIRLSEVQPSSFPEQACTLVFPDHHYYTEKTVREHGVVYDRKIYEGELAEEDWNSLITIIDSKEFRAIKVPRDMDPLVVNDAHPYNITVAREPGFQNLEFLNRKALKPYSAQLDPLLKWWKTLRGRPQVKSAGPPDPRCSLEGGRVLISP